MPDHMSEAPGKVPDTLSTITPLPEPKPGEWEPRTRRPRSNRSGTRANTRFQGKPGDQIFRIVRDNKTMRKWAAGRKYDVADHGPVPVDIQEAFDEWMKLNGLWTMEVISLQPPGADKPSAFIQVRQGQVVARQTTDPFYAKREMGDEVYHLLTPPPRRKRKKT